MGGVCVDNSGQCQGPSIVCAAACGEPAAMAFDKEVHVSGQDRGADGDQSDDRT